MAGFTACNGGNCRHKMQSTTQCSPRQSALTLFKMEQEMNRESGGLVCERARAPLNLIK